MSSNQEETLSLPAHQPITRSAETSTISAASPPPRPPTPPQISLRRDTPRIVPIMESIKTVLERSFKPGTGNNSQNNNEEKDEDDRNEDENNYTAIPSPEYTGQERGRARDRSCSRPESTAAKTTPLHLEIQARRTSLTSRAFPHTVSIHPSDTSPTTTYGSSPSDIKPLNAENTSPTSATSATPTSATSATSTLSRTTSLTFSLPPSPARLDRGKPSPLAGRKRSGIPILEVSVEEAEEEEREIGKGNKGRGGEDEEEEEEVVLEKWQQRRRRVEDGDGDSD